MPTITDVKTARALITFERDRNKVVYSAYIAANAVTLDTVSDHVAALTELAFPNVTTDAADEVKAARKGFMNRVRNGLNHRLGKRTPSQEAAEPSTVEPEVAEVSQTSDNAFVETPAEAIHRVVHAAYAAGLTRDDVLAAVEAAL